MTSINSNCCYMVGFLMTLVPLCFGHVDLTTLLNRIENLEIRDMEQFALIDVLKQQVRVSNDKLHYLSTSKSILEKQHAATSKKLAKQEDIISSLQKDLEQQKSVADNSIQKTEILQSEVQQMGAEIEKTNRIIARCKNDFQEKLNDIKATKSDEHRQEMKQDNAKENTDTNSLKLPHDDTLNSEPASQPSDKDELSSVQADKFETYGTNKALLDPAERKGGRKIQSQEKRHIETRHRGSRSFRNSRPRSVTNTVAFHAVLSPHQVQHLGTNDNIKFDTTLLNEGSGYHSQHGLFIAPKPGFYLFSVTIASNFDKPFSADIRKNGASLANIAGDGVQGRFLDQGSVTVVTKLNVGDEVWVVHVDPADGSIWGNWYSSFTGILIAGFE